ncbi:10838_t:CDS:2, partial [Entrophospora sp. SA101]
EALKGNKKNQDGKQHTLSIITNDFTYQELKTNLNVRELTFSFVGEHTILEACKHADIYGPGALSLSKPIITRNMEGLCSISNEYGYEVFSEIEGTLKKDIENIHFQKKLIEGLQTLKRVYYVIYVLMSLETMNNDYMKSYIADMGYSNVNVDINIYNQLSTNILSITVWYCGDPECEGTKLTDSCTNGMRNNIKQYDD